MHINNKLLQDGYLYYSFPLDSSFKNKREIDFEGVTGFLMVIRKANILIKSRHLSDDVAFYMKQFIVTEQKLKYTTKRNGNKIKKHEK